VQQLDRLHQIMVNAVQSAGKQLQGQPLQLASLMTSLRGHIPPSCLLTGPQALRSMGEVSAACAQEALNS
jgi:hypothetical protein